MSFLPLRDGKNISGLCSSHHPPPLFLQLPRNHARHPGHEDGHWHQISSQWTLWALRLPSYIDLGCEQIPLTLLKPARQSLPFFPEEFIDMTGYFMQILMPYIFCFIPSKQVARPFVFLCLECLKNGKLKLLEGCASKIMLDIWEGKVEGKKDEICLVWEECKLVCPHSPSSTLQRLQDLWSGYKDQTLRFPNIAGIPMLCRNRAPALHGSVSSTTGISALNNAGWRLESSLQILCIIWRY